MNALVKNVMTINVISVKEDTPYEAIVAALREHRISAVPVVDGASRVIGVVSESDLLAKLALGIDEDTRPGNLGIVRWHQLEKARAITAADLMTTPAYTVSPDDTVEQGAQIMYRRHVKRLPVTDTDGHLAGIVSRTDLLAVFGRTDAGIAEEIRLSIFAGQQHPEGRHFDVSVQAGVATIYGRPLAAAQGHAIIRHARHVQGVVAVRDRLDYPLPRESAFDVPASFPPD